MVCTISSSMGTVLTWEANMSDINKIENNIQEMALSDTLQQEFESYTLEFEENTQIRNNITDLDVAQYEFTITLVEAIIRKRKAMNLSQEQLAKIAGVGRATIARLESWQRVSINLKVAFKLLNALNLKLMISDES